MFGFSLHSDSWAALQEVPQVSNEQSAVYGTDSQQGSIELSDNLPWFPFYIDKWETDPRVRAMGPVARSYYLTLLLVQWREGVIPESCNTLRRLLVLPSDPVKRLPSFPPDYQSAECDDGVDREAVLNQVLECFKSDGKGGLLNETLAELRIESMAIYEAKSRGGKAKKRKKIEGVMEDPLKTQGGDLHIQLQKTIEKNARKLAHQLPSDFSTNEYHRTLSAKLGVNLASEFEQFKDHHGARGTKFKDWNLALNTWLRNAQRFSKATTNTGPQNVSANYVSVGQQRRNERDAAKVAQ